MKTWEKKWLSSVRNAENATKKIIAESVEEAKGDPKGADKLMRRDVEKNPRDDMRADKLISNWCTKFGYFPYQLLKNRWNPFLGEGAQGRVYGVTKNGKLFAVKLVNKARGFKAEDEWKIRNRFANIYTKMPDHVKKHFPKIYDMGEYEADKNSLGTKASPEETAYYYYVMEFLQPLDAHYAKYFQGNEGRANMGPFPVRTEEYDIFRTERYGDLQKAYNRLIDILCETGDDYRRIFRMNSLEMPTDAEQEENVKLIKEFADEILYETWFSDFKKQAFSKMQTENQIAIYVSNKLSANFKKKGTNSKKLAAKLTDKKLNDLPYGPNIIKKMRDLAAEIAVAEFNKFMQELFYKFGRYVADQSIPYSYYSSGDPGESGFRRDTQIDVDLLRSGPVTEFREAMIHAARNYDLNVSDIKAANVMQRGKELVITDIGLWGSSELS